MPKQSFAELAASDSESDESDSEYTAAWGALDGTLNPQTLSAGRVESLGLRVSGS